MERAIGAMETRSAELPIAVEALSDALLDLT